MDDLIGEFVADTRDGYERLMPALDAWAADPADRAALDALFRFAHTVKGNAGFLSIGRFVTLCDAVEQALVAVRDDGRVADAALVAGMVQLIHRVGALAEAIGAGTGLPAHDEPALIAAIGAKSAAPALTPNPQAEAQLKARSIRMPADQFEQLAGAVEEVAAAHRDLIDRVMFAPGVSPAVGPAMTALSTRIAAMTRALSLSRLLPIERVAAGLDRIVTQTAAALGKQASFWVERGDLLVDRDIVDGLREAVVHLVRNALDHGIESPPDRIALGKPLRATIRLSARISDCHVVLELSDDGRGIDQAALMCAASTHGLPLKDMPGHADGEALAAILAIPGLTTAEAGSALSGRGVGLDAVRVAVERLGGTLAVRANPGVGAAFVMTVPLKESRASAA